MGVWRFSALETGRVGGATTMMARIGVGLRSETLIDVVALPYHALMMEGDEFQKVLQHGVPSINLTPKNFADGIIPHGADDPRYSFTFRHHVEPTTKRKSAAGHKRGRDSPLSAAPDESA